MIKQFNTFNFTASINTRGVNLYAKCPNCNNSFNLHVHFDTQCARINCSKCLYEEYYMRIRRNNKE